MRRDCPAHDAAVDRREHSKYGNITYGKITAGSLLDGLEELIWVDANPLIKEPKWDEIYIEYAPDTFVTLDKIDLLGGPQKETKKSHYFYIYYLEKSKEKPVDKEELKRKLIEYFSTIN